MKMELDRLGGCREVANRISIGNQISAFSRLLEMLTDDDMFVIERDLASMGYDGYVLYVRGDQRVHIIDELSKYKIAKGLNEYSMLALEIPELKQLVEIASELVFSASVVQNVLSLRFFVNDTFFTFKVKISTSNEDIMSQYLSVVKGYKPLVITLLNSSTSVYTDVVKQVVEESQRGQLYSVDKYSQPTAYMKRDGELIDASRF